MQFTYYAPMQGIEQDFTFLSSRGTFNVYSISTMTDDGSVAYLKPQTSSGDIVAMVQTQPLFIFRLTNQPPPPQLCQSNHETDRTANNSSGCPCM